MKLKIMKQKDSCLASDLHLSKVVNTKPLANDRVEAPARLRAKEVAGTLQYIKVAAQA